VGLNPEYRKIIRHATRQIQIQQRFAVAIVHKEESTRAPALQLDERTRGLSPLRFS
jgi:hypothetical protein